MIELKKELFDKIDSNNLKASAILKAVLFTLINDGDCTEFDIVSALESVQDYLADTDNIFNTI